MTRPALVAVAAAVGLLLGSAGPALAAQPYPLNFNTVDFSAGMISGLDDASGTLTLGSGSLPSVSYVDPHASVPVLADHAVAHGQFIGPQPELPVPGSVPLRSRARRNDRRVGQLLLRHLDITCVRPLVPVQRARLVVEREDVAGDVDPVGSASATRRRALGLEVVHPRPLGVQRLRFPSHLGRRPGQRGRLRLDRHLLCQGSSGDRVPAAVDDLSAHRADGGGGARLGQSLQRGRVEPDEPERQLPERDDDARGDGRSRRDAVLAGAPPRPLSGVRQRRRGVVQPDLDRDGRAVLAGRDRSPVRADVGRDVLGRPA